MDNCKNGNMTVANLKKIIMPVLLDYKISRAGLFGSYVRNENTEESDVDILVQIDEQISLLEFVRIKLELEEKLQKKVDLVEYKAIKPRLREQILSEEIRIYG